MLPYLTIIRKGKLLRHLEEELGILVAEYNPLMLKGSYIGSDLSSSRPKESNTFAVNNNTDIGSEPSNSTPSLMKSPEMAKLEKQIIAIKSKIHQHAWQN